MMSILKQLDRVVQYFSGAFVRIFGPSDDSYPETGVQPFEGTPNKKAKSSD
ncbi:isochorismate synthase [Stenomitos frigidus ULC18]|uniref:Isochorismate synthase n=1 Tax=Stenomitos frigidus ULC18 TaxID=2107698 RepID=A0A2T1EEP3_9CYAN|nr:isochorismate synthase [Stenomitos frigidus ULC18]